MALVHVTNSANKRNRQSHHLSPEYACATNSSIIERKLRRDTPIHQCSCACKENVERRDNAFSACDTILARGRNSEVVEDICADPCTNRKRTYSVCKAMHDKGINVYVMPENMPELFLDSYNYNSKQNLEWTHDSDEACCHSVTTDARSSLHIRVNDESSFKENFEDSEAS